ncbi:MAG: DNA mismatch repair protein MutL, partial [Lachnospiraceae bacterium]|nr:DNA mismatch repair protein MutL [Lachnospiraceae bacterium]
EIANELVWLEKEEDGRRLSGFLGSPLTGRASRSFENYYINGRFVKSPVIAKAVEEAYKPYLMQHKYPFFVLHFTLEPDTLDVNVHPSKMEVRFHEQSRVAEFIYNAVRDTLSGKEMLKEITFPEQVSPKEQASQKEPPAREHVPEPFEIQARRLQGLGKKSEPFSQGQETLNQKREAAPMESKPQSAFQRIDYRESAPASAATVAEELVFPSRNLSENIIKKEEHIFVEKPVQMNFFDEKLLTKQLRDEYRLIGQVFNTYWMIELHDKLLIIDQHAAHEKIKYERLCKQIKEADISSQQLNPPVILTFSGREEAVYQEYESYFRQMGFEIEPFGGNEYAVRSVPVDLFGRNAKELLMEIMDELSDGPVKGEPDVILQKLASMSCKAAVKGGHAISREEAETLIDELLTLDNPYHCPHGRPTVITMSKYEMEKKFSRIV